MKKRSSISRAFLHLSLKSPIKLTPFKIPQWGLYGESCPFREPSFICLSDSSKQVLLVEKSYPSLEGPRKGGSLPYSPKMGPIWKQTLISRTLLYISFGVPSKGAPLPDSPHKAAIERDALFPDPSFFCLSRVPGK